MVIVAVVGVVACPVRASQHGLRNLGPYVYGASQTLCLSVWACAACVTRRHGCGLGHDAVGMSIPPAARSPAAVGSSVLAVHASQHGLRSSEPYLYHVSQARCLSFWTCAVCVSRRCGCGLVQAALGVSMRPAVLDPAAVGSSTRAKLASQHGRSSAPYLYDASQTLCLSVWACAACVTRRRGCGLVQAAVGASIRPAVHDPAVGSSMCAILVSQHGRGSGPYVYDAPQTLCWSVWACAACVTRMHNCGPGQASVGASLRPATLNPAGLGVVHAVWVVNAVVRSRFTPVSVAHCGEGREAGVGEGHKFPCCPVHAHACAYLPEHVGGRGVALVWGCDGGDVGDDRPQFPFVGPGWAHFPSLLSWSCLLPLLCGHKVPASGEREHPSLSPAGRFRCSFRVYFLLLRPFPMGLGGAGLVCGGGGSPVRQVCSIPFGAVVGVPFPVPFGRPGSRPDTFVGDGGLARTPPVVGTCPKRAM